MSGLPYLNKLRKPELVEFAEKTDLQDYSDYNKNDLAVALDKHLRENRSIFSGDKKLAEYYKRLAQPPRGGSPAEKKAPGRKAKKEEETAEDSEETTAKTPARSSARAVRSALEVQAPLPPSPAVVTDAIDRQSAKLRQGLEHAWTASGVLEHSHALRGYLSSLKAVQTLFLIVEGGFVLHELIPMAYLATLPAVPAVRLPAVPVKAPDVFVLLTGAFWAPFALWILTNLALPLICAYFINLSWQAATGGSAHTPARRTRASSSGRASFDPLTFNITKSLLVYLVYAEHFTFWDMFSYFAVQKVNVSVPGQWSGMLTGTAIGVVGTLYEAILRRS